VSQTKLKPITTITVNDLKTSLMDVSTEFTGMKNYINDMVARISDYEEEMKITQIQNKALSKEIKFQNRVLLKQLTKNSLIKKQKEEFITMMSHEFKTPLTPIISWTDILLSNTIGDVNNKQVDALKKIKINSIKLLELMTDVLDANKLNLNAMIFDKSMISSKQIVNNLIKNYVDELKKQNIKFIFSDTENISLYSDPNRIEQILRIFIINSIDFVPDTGGEIEIKVKQEKDFVLFSIIDNGIGISKQNLPKLFEKFYQTDSSSTRLHGGSGLGLTVAKGIVEGLNGEIGVKSILNEGSTFFIKIPIASENIYKKFL